MAGADELRRLEADLTKGLELGKVRAAVDASGKNVQHQLRAEAKGSRHFKLASRITTESRESLGGPGVEVGPEKRGAGNLGVIAYFGGRNGGGGTLPDPQGALDAEMPEFFKSLSELAEGIL